MRQPIVKNWTNANDWLNGGRDKYKNYRSLYVYGNRCFLQRNKDNSITIHWWNGPLLTYYPDNSILIGVPERIRWYQSERQAVSKYTDGCKMVQRNGVLYLSVPGDGTTGSNVKKCRACSGHGMVDGWCNEFYDWCDDKACPITEQRYALMEAGSSRWDDDVRDLMHKTIAHNNDKCSHGSTAMHKIKRVNKCWKCHGYKVREYGFRLKAQAYTGPVLIDAQGRRVTTS